ncbi:MAG: hypothetical protein MZV70_46940 [Desulfobacterales bacterium]|nr:hypothetical protein [Desulfobacterales bacterium]
MHPMPAVVGPGRHMVEDPGVRQGEGMLHLLIHAAGRERALRRPPRPYPRRCGSPPPAAAAPPMPSATVQKPRSGLAAKASSLFVRFIPTSVIPKASTSSSCSSPYGGPVFLFVQRLRGLPGLPAWAAILRSRSLVRSGEADVAVGAGCLVTGALARGMAVVGGSTGRVSRPHSPWTWGSG